MGNQQDLAAIVDASEVIEELFDRVPDVVFFVKDLRGRYRAVNSTLVLRCGAGGKEDLLGRTAEEVFPPPLGTRFLEQDLEVCTSGTPITQRLELHLYPSRREGWCLTDKIPLVDDAGKVTGLAGISRDMMTGGKLDDGADDLARTLDRVHESTLDPPSVDALAAEVGLSAYQLNRRLRLLLGITARQLLVKARVDAASRLLRTSDLAIGDVAQQSGYYDQSAFTRQFRRTTGLTPRQYRDRHRPAS